MKKQVVDYFQRVLNKNFDEIEAADSQACRHSFRIVKYVGALVVVINLFWIVTDLLDKQDSLNLTKGFSAASLIVLTVFSVVIIILSCLRNLRISSSLEQSLMFAYYLVIIATVVILRVTKNVTIVENNAASMFTGVSLSSYYLLLIVVAPLPSLLLGGILLIFSLVSLILPVILPGAEAYNLLQNSILQAVSITVYLVIRLDYIRLASSKVNTEDLNRQLIVSSYVDELSGLLNRRAYDDYLEFLMNDDSVKDIGVFMFDVDNFKSYNDTYSHLKGDIVLKEISDAVADELETDGIFVFRYGGEEFIVLSENPDTKAAERTAERIVNAVRKKAIPRGDVPGFQIVTVTVGYAIEPNTGSASQDMIIRADNALYEGKKITKNCAVASE